MVITAARHDLGQRQRLGHLLLLLSGVVAYLPTAVEMYSVSYFELVISVVYRHDIYRGYTWYVMSILNERTLWGFHILLSF